MAVKSIFKNAILESVGTLLTDLYTAPAGKASILIELDACNIINTGVVIDVILVKAAGPTARIVKGAPVPVGSTIQVVYGQKIVLEEGDTIQVKSSVDASLDIVSSVIEDVNS